MPPIETKFDGDTSNIGNLSTELNSLSTNIVNTWASELRSGHSVATDDWTGVSSGAFDGRASLAEGALTDVSGNVNKFKTAVDVLKGELESVEKTLSDARIEASNNNLPVSGTVINQPERPSFLGPQPSNNDKSEVVSGLTEEQVEQVNEYSKKVLKYNELVERVDTAREKEKKAHETFQNSCLSITNPMVGGSKGALDAIKGVNSNLSKANNIIKSVISAHTLSFGSLNKDANARFVSKMDALTKGSAASRLKALMRETVDGAKSSLTGGIWGRLKGKTSPLGILTNPDNWEIAQRGRRNIAGLLNVDMSKKSLAYATKALKFADKAGKVLGPIGTALDVATCGYAAYKGGADQWHQDSADPTLTTGDKIVRAGAQGAWDAMPKAAEAVGSAAGSAAGAAIGTAAFAWTGPAAPLFGTAGSVVGGYVGGKIGGAVGNWIHDTFDDSVSKAIDNFKPSKALEKLKFW